MTSHVVPIDPGHPVLSDHRYGGDPVVSAAQQIDLLLATAPSRLQASLHQVTFLVPARVSEACDAVVTVTDGKADLSIGRLATCRAVLVAEPLPAPEYIDIDEAGLTAHSDQDLQALRAWREDECAMTYGPTYRVMRTFRRSGERAVGLARADVHGLVVPPAVLDSIFQTLAFLSGAPHGGGLPWTVGSVVVRRAVTEPVYLLVERTSARPGLVEGNASLVTAHGELVVQVNGITMKAPPARAATAAPGSVETVVLRPVGDLRHQPPPARWHTYQVPASVDGDPHAALTSVMKDLRPLVHGRERVDHLRVVTSGAWSTDEDGPDPVHAAVWALLGPLRQEHPKVTIQAVDVPRGPRGMTWDELPPAEQLVLTTTGWNVPERRQVDARPTPRAFPGSYLITGGLGGLAAHVAAWLVDNGARHVRLLSRRPPTPQDEDRIGRLRAGGATITHQVADITDPDLDLARDSWPYDAIFHTAGVLEDGLLVTATPSQVSAVLAPKTAGVATLQRYVTTSPDTEVVLFSSVAAVDGRRGQGVYAAANAYMDATAAGMRAAGRRWYSLQWGLWSTGMGAAIHEQAADAGYPVIHTDHGRALLDHALALPPHTYVLPGTPVPPHDTETLGATMTTTNAPTTPAELLYTVIGGVLGLDSVSGTDAPNDLGLDSMMAVEVSAAMAEHGHPIDPADLFSAGTLAGVAAGLSPSPDGPPAPPPGPVVSPSAAAETFLDARSAPAPPAPDPQASPPPAPAVPRVPADHVVTDGPDQAGPPPTVWDEYRLPAAAPPPEGPAPQQVAEVPGPTAATAPEPPRPPSTKGSGDNRYLRSLPNRIDDDPTPTSLAARLNEISSDDRRLVAAGEYFYEPVVTANRGSQIEVDGSWMLNFASYSYLGLIEDDYIRRRTADQVLQRGSAAHGVRLLAGTSDVHRRLEQSLARFVGTQDAIVFSSGYMANVATIAALMAPGDVIIGDVLNHASILDGYRLSGAEVIPYAHNDVRDLRRALAKAAGRRTLVVTDAVFSMDGDIAALPDIQAACAEHGATLMVDEAHSLGVLGETGRGITEHYPATGVDVLMGTLSKTIPSIGGYVAGNNDLIFALKNNARGWMFSAALPPGQAEAALAALEVISASPSRVARLQELSADYRSLLQKNGFDTMNSSTPVVPIRCASSRQATQMAHLCQQQGIFVQPITYPTVPVSTPRLRTIVNLTHTRAEIDHAVRVFAETGRAVGLI